MEITTIYWREDALNNMKDILASHYRQGKKFAERMINAIIDDLENIKERPYLGYIEPSMMGQSKRVMISFITRRQLKVLYYVEDDTLYIIDFWDN